MEIVTWYSSAYSRLSLCFGFCATMYFSGEERFTVYYTQTYMMNRVKSTGTRIYTVNHKKVAVHF